MVSGLPLRGLLVPRLSTRLALYSPTSTVWPSTVWSLQYGLHSPASAAWSLQPGFSRAPSEAGSLRASLRGALLRGMLHSEVSTQGAHSKVPAPRRSTPRSASRRADSLPTRACGRTETFPSTGTTPGNETLPRTLQPGNCSQEQEAIQENPWGGEVPRGRVIVTTL